MIAATVWVAIFLNPGVIASAGIADSVVFTSEAKCLDWVKEHPDQFNGSNVIAVCQPKEIR